MTITPEQIKQLQELAARVKDEYDREKFLVALAELMAYVDEVERGLAA